MLAVSTYTKGYRVAGLLAAIDSSGPGVVKLYDGAAPANCGGLTTQVLYASIPLKTPSGYVSGTTLSLYAPDYVQNVATGTVSWARILNGGGTVVFDCDVGDNASSAVIKLASTALTINLYTYLQSITITEV